MLFYSNSVPGTDWRKLKINDLWEVCCLWQRVEPRSALLLCQRTKYHHLDLSQHWLKAAGESGKPYKPCCTGKPYKPCPTCKPCLAQTDSFHLQQEQCSRTKGYCPYEWWCFDLMLLLQLLPSGLLWRLSWDWSCMRWSSWMNESAGNICVSPRWMLPGKRHLKLAQVCRKLA